eukprot:6214678-Pleurochrysis_carterae.AAC.4
MPWRDVEPLAATESVLSTTGSTQCACYDSLLIADSRRGSREAMMKHCEGCLRAVNSADAWLRLRL